MKKLAVVIVNYNVKHYVEQCLLSLRRALVDIDAEVYVVDNHSRDGSVDFLSSKFDDIKIIRCNHNQGFARANNIAIGQSESEYVLLLNPDTIVGEQTISDTLAFPRRWWRSIRCAAFVPVFRIASVLGAIT